MKVFRSESSHGSDADILRVLRQARPRHSYIDYHRRLSRSCLSRISVHILHPVPPVTPSIRFHPARTSWAVRTYWYSKCFWSWVPWPRRVKLKKPGAIAIEFAVPAMIGLTLKVAGIKVDISPRWYATEAVLTVTWVSICRAFGPGCIWVGYKQT